MKGIRPPYKMPRWYMKCGKDEMKPSECVNQAFRGPIRKSRDRTIIHGSN